MRLKKTTVEDATCLDCHVLLLEAGMADTDSADSPGVAEKDGEDIRVANAAGIKEAVADAGGTAGTSADETDDGTIDPAVAQLLSNEPAHEAFLELSAGTPLVDANGLEVNAHTMVGNVTHDGIECVSCHEIHDDTLPAEQGKKICNSCHHADVFECFTCHEHG